MIGTTTFALLDGQNLNFALPVAWIEDLRGHPFTGATQTQAEKNSSDALALWQQEEKALQLGEYEKVRRLLESISQLMPDDPSVWACLGTIHIHFHDSTAALTACNRAIQLDRQNHDAWSCLGDYYFQDDDHLPQAETALREAVRIDPSRPEDWLGLGLIYGLEGKHDLAMQAYYKLKVLDSNLADELYKRAMADSRARTATSIP